MPDQPLPHGLARELAAVAGATAGATPDAGMGPSAGECGGEHDLRGRTGEPGTPGGTPSNRKTRLVETSRGILSDAELAPFLGERVLACKEAIVTGAFADRPLDERLLLEFHRRIAGDLVPEWAGRWRAIEVQVGNLRPPPPYRLPQLFRDYAAGLPARWGECSRSPARWPWRPLPLRGRDSSRSIRLWISMAG